MNVYNASDYRGPSIIFSISAAVPDLPLRPLRECVSDWGVQSAKQWDVIESEPGASAFSFFLDYLYCTVNYENTDYQKTVLAWLTKLADEDSQELRSVTFQIAKEATQSCEDRVSLAFNQMKMLILAHEVEMGRYDERLPELIERTRGLFRLESLGVITREKADSLNFVDEIEVFLTFQIKLRDSLGLPLDTSDMRFFNVSWVRKEDLANAKKRVKREEQEEFLHYLSTDWQPW